MEWMEPARTFAALAARGLSNRNRKKRSRRNASEKPWTWHLHRELRKRAAGAIVTSYLVEHGIFVDDSSAGCADSTVESDADGRTRPEQAAVAEPVAAATVAALLSPSKTVASPDDLQCWAGSVADETIAESFKSGAKKLFPTVPEADNGGDQCNEASLEPNQKRQKRQYQRSTSSVTAGDRVVKGVPSNFTLTLKTFLSQLKKDRSKLDRLRGAISAGKFNWGHEARILLAAGFAEIPQASQYGVEQMVPCVVAALLTETGIDFDREKLAASLPSAATVGTILKEAAADR